MQQTVKTACKRIWSRPYTNLCLHSDLPRLSHNLEIVDEKSGQMVRHSALLPPLNGDPNALFLGIVAMNKAKRRNWRVAKHSTCGGFWNQF